MFKGAIKASMTRCLRMVLQRHPRPHPHEGAFAHLSSRPVKSCRDSRAWLTQVMKPTTFFQMNSASAGAVLRITDLVTGISALKHAQSHGAVTLAFDRVSLSQPIKAFDMLRVESEAVSVGNSSMLVMCKGFHEDLHTGQLTPVMKSFVTYVAMGEDFRPTQVPLLSQPNPHSEMVQKRAQTLKEWEANAIPADTSLEDLREMFGATAHLDREAIAKVRRQLPPTAMSSTRRRFRKEFLPRNTNFAGNVFGGDFLQWMEECARLCATGFADWPKFVTLNMSQVFFKAAVHMGDVVDLEAEVVYATKHTVHVQTRVKIHRQTPNTPVKVLEDSHSGTFVCLCINDGENGGGKRPIGRKLLVTAEDGDTEGGDEEERLRLWRYMSAKRSHELFMHAGFHDEDPAEGLSVRDHSYPVE